jgi:hypothetical protein
VGNVGSCLTLSAYGKVGINIGVAIPICTITAPPVGKYKIWGMGRHAIDDGLRIHIGSLTLPLSAPALTQLTLDPPLVMNLDGSTDLIVETNAATGLVGLASFTMFAQRQCEHLSEHSC